MTREQLHILQHSLGLNQYGQGTFYRNHYCGDPESCRPLVELGYMKEHPASELTGGDPLFTVTEQGKLAVKAESPAPPKLTRSQLKYRAFLDSGAGDCGDTFGDWLKRKRAQ